eukprot:TRINITY_DN553_c0_g1_i10.p2 TRINITY_DN553_c0_g1~~TRINITY_DN553_c0_g1_i10.p2  ORF type:complete len:107 (-),score=26.11 TRINITY_DN553_c0_g1_i10:113-433(-)
MCIRDSINAEYGNPHVMEHASGLPALAPQANLTKTEFWTQKVKEIETHTDFKTQQLPLARIKKIMKSDEDVRMISAEAPVVFAQACELFIMAVSYTHLTLPTKRIV